MTDGRLDLDVLADLDAGLLDAERAAQVRAAAAGDPRASAALAALAATRADLAGLPDPAVPPQVAARWAAALDTEAVRGHTLAEQSLADPQPAYPTAGASPDTARSDPAARLGRLRPRPALVAAVVLAAAVVAGALWGRPDPLPSLDRVDLAAAGRAALGTTDVGDLADPARRAACLRVVGPPGVAPDAPLLGGRRVEVDGRPAVLLVLASGELGRFHIAVVDPGCGPGGGALLRSADVGR
jgi:hypothetical protein